MYLYLRGEKGRIMNQHRRNVPASKKGKKLRLFNAALLTLVSLVSGLLVFSIFKNNVLAFHHLNFILSALLAAVILPAKIGRASCRERCRSRWSPYHYKKKYYQKYRCGYIHYSSP